MVNSLPAISTPAVRLCSACGMCCDGSLFHHVKLQPGDSVKKLLALRLKLKRKHTDDLLLQPCVAHGECGCSIYQDRPERCRLFNCRQLVQVAAGEITEAQAAEKIAHAIGLLKRIHELFRLSGETSPKGPLTKRYARIVTEPPSEDAEALEVREQLTRTMEKLQALLDADFRVE